jgi:hypothetical protein
MKIYKLLFRYINIKYEYLISCQLSQNFEYPILWYVDRYGKYAVDLEPNSGSLIRRMCVYIDVDKNIFNDEEYFKIKNIVTKYNRINKLNELDEII